MPLNHSRCKPFAARSSKPTLAAATTPSAPTAPQRHQAFNVNEVADLLAVTPITIYRLCSQGLIPHFKVGAAIRFSPERVAIWIEQHSIGGAR